MIDNPFEAPREPDFPPLFQARALRGSLDPFQKACALAALGCDSGVLVHNIGADRLRAAMVFAPEMPLGVAMAAFCACATGFQNAFGALAPPEVALHLTWGGDILINGARAGRLRVAASHTDPGTVPDWLVAGFEIRLIPQSQAEPGDAPDETCLYLEGCAGIAPLELLEGWARHTLVWINGLAGGEARALHGEWRELLHGIGGKARMRVDGREISGTFLGTDDDFAMLLRDGDDTHLVPLTALLNQKEPP